MVHSRLALGFPITSGGCCKCSAQVPAEAADGMHSTSGLLHSLVSSRVLTYESVTETAHELPIKFHIAQSYRTCGIELIWQDKMVMVRCLKSSPG